MTRATPPAAPSLVEAALPSFARRAADLAGLATVEAVVAGVVRGARELLTSDVAYLTMQDDATGEFSVRGSEGFLSDAFLSDRSSRRGIGIYGYVVDHARPLWSDDYLRDERFPHFPETNASIAAEGIRGLAGAPAPRPGHELPGVVFVGWRSVRAFSEDEIALLVAWGAVAGAAVEAAELRQQLARDSAGARREVVELGREVAGLRRLGAAIERLARTAAQTAAPEDVLAVLGEDLGAAVVLYDDAGAVHASWGAGTPPHTADGAARALASRSEEQGRAVAQGGVCVAAVASRSGVLGHVVAELTHPPSDIDLGVLDAGALHLGALLLSRERLIASQSRDMGDTLRGLLGAAPEDLGSLFAHVARYGLRLDERRTVVAVVDLGRLPAGKALDRTRQAVAEHAAVFGLHDGRLVVLLDGPGAAPVLERLPQALSREGAAGTVCVDPAPRTGAELPGAVVGARQCLALALALGRSGCTSTVAELAPYAAAFGGLHPGELDDFIRSVIGPVLDHDAARGTGLVETLSVHLSNGGNVRNTAEALYVHPNTVRQRLGVLGRLLPALEDPSRRFDVHLALRLHGLRPTGS